MGMSQSVIVARTVVQERPKKRRLFRISLMAPSILLSMPSPSSHRNSAPTTAATCNLRLKKTLPCLWLLLLVSLRLLSRSQYHQSESVIFKGELVHPVSVAPTERDTSEVNKAPFVHIIKTRFMQFQPNLLHLGYARLALFKTFCLPSMLSQTNQNFLWVIRTDPNLNPELLQPLIRLLEGRPNFILLGSTDNPTGFSRHESNMSFDEYLFAHEQETINKAKRKYAVSADAKNAKAIVFSGNLTLLEQAFNSTSNASGIVLETRLDADDGLHRDFVSTIQGEAMKYLPHSVKHMEESDSHPTNLWRIWCVDADVEWHPISPQQGHDNSQIQEQGYLVMHRNEGCVTPGLSIAFGAGYRSKPDLLNGHAHIHKETEICTTSKQIGCYNRLNELAPAGAIRARTTTSAGMQKVGIVLKEKTIDDDLWKVFDFVPLQAVKEARQWIVEHQSAIAKDNLNGHCTPHHSCKHSSIEILSQLSNSSAAAPVDMII